jgi:hypothetical protein
MSRQKCNKYLCYRYSISVDREFIDFFKSHLKGGFKVVGLLSYKCNTIWSLPGSSGDGDRLWAIVRNGMALKPVYGVDWFTIKKTRATYAVLSFTGVHHLRSGLFKGDNHHKDPVIYFSLTSSRIDSIRASQHLVFNSMIGI